VPLTASPANIVVGQSDAFLEVRNATNTPITINAISLANPAAGQGIFPGPAPNCQAGLTLAVNQICNLIVAFELE
jgi:hypothetical protein